MNHFKVGDGFKRVCSALALTGKNKVHPYSLPLGSSSATAIEAASSGEAAAEEKMGKSNKFDYSNRSSSGEKLGCIIGRDLEKEVDKVIKDADKQAAKVRKASVGSNASITSSIDQHDSIKQHVLDIKAPNKNLGDEGACAMVVGLENALNKAGPTSASAVLLEDLNLSGNSITTVTLARLAPVIELSKYDLKTLNLANNDIKVDTDEEALQWEEFLQSFRACHKLRRLDLSNNPKLGSRALEILARIHILEPLIEPVPARGNVSVYSLAEHSSEGDEDNMDTPTISSFDRMTTGGVLKRRCGLRSIPYITLTNIGLTDSGALWLSYVLEDHYFPTQLIDEINATLPDSMIATYQQGSACGGVEWDKREGGLGKDGLYLLKKTESIRRATQLDDESMLTSSVLIVGEDHADATTRRSFDQGNSRARQGDRRASIRSIRTSDGGEHELSELDSVRKRLQRHVIAHDGASSVELWRAGMKIANHSSVLSGLGPAERNFYIGPPTFHFPTGRTACSSPVTPINGCKRARNASMDSSPPVMLRQGTYAHTLTLNTSAAPGEQELAITEVTNSPITPKMVFKPHRKGAFSDGSDLQVVTQKLEEQTLAGTIARDDSPARFIRMQESLINDHGGNKAYRNPNAPSHLPQYVMRRIVESTVPMHEQGLLSKKQHEQAFDWGQDRANFTARESWRKMADSAQVWNYLESIGCLAYQRE